MITPIFNKDVVKILTLFSLSPGSRFNRNQIKEKTIMNNVPLDNALNLLLQTELIKKEKRLYSFNFDNNYYKKFLDIVSSQYKKLKEIPLKIYFIIIDITYELTPYKCIELYLFGSYSKLIYKENSDIDLALLSNKKLNINRIIAKIEKKYNKNIELHYFNKKEFYKNKKDPLIKDILKNGIKII